jgi:hypothetical protein
VTGTRGTCLGVEEGDVDVLAAARGLGVAEGGEDADGGVHAREKVRHRHPHLRTEAASSAAASVDAQ